MQGYLPLIQLIAGLCLMLFGAQLVGDELQSIAGPRFRKSLSRFTSNPFKGLLAGITLTGVLQSSSVTAVLIVTLVNAGIITLATGIALLLGVNIGGTVAVQLIAFNVFAYAPLLIIIGILARLVTRYRPVSSVGSVILGIGFVFYALSVMSTALKPLASNALFQEVLQAFNQTPLYTIMIAALFTAMAQNSAVTVGLALVFALNGLMTLPQTMPLILGANLGITATALVSSLGKHQDARRLAIANLIVKSAGVLFFAIFLQQFSWLIAQTSSDVGRQVANAHTLFNVITALVFLPMTGLLAKAGRILVPDKSEKADDNQPRFLDDMFIENPSVALGESVRETLRLANAVERILRNIPECFTQPTDKLFKEIFSLEEKVDTLEEAIKHYLIQVGSDRPLTTSQAHRQVGILTIATRLENTADLVSKNIMGIAQKKKQLGGRFSEPGWNDIMDLYQQVFSNYRMAITAFANNDKDLARQVVHNKQANSQQERVYRLKHIERLRQGLAESIETSEIHLDLLTNLRMIDSHTASIARAVIGENTH